MSLMDVLIESVRTHPGATVSQVTTDHTPEFTAAMLQAAVRRGLLTCKLGTDGELHYREATK